MRRAAVALAGVAVVGALLAGCERTGDPPVDLGVTTPPPSSAPGGGGGGSAPPTGTTPPPPQSSAPPPAPGGTPLAEFQLLAGTWQRERSLFFASINRDQPLTLAQQHAVAAAYLRAMRQFAAGIRGNRWPPRAARAIREMLASNASQQAHVAAMSRAASQFAFTQRLGEYGVGAARENRAVTAVQRALGG